jgi:(4S)-4-hydroxy-5-phosphonooxypentane-2,3-dione isomerase
MIRSTTFLSAAALVFAAWPQPGGGQALAQSAPLYINVADIDVYAGSTDKFMAALKANAAASVQEAGCREIEIGIPQDNPQHVFIFEIYNSAGAWDSHQATAHFLKFYGIAAPLMSKLDLKPFSSVALNGSAPTQAAKLLFNVVDLDIVAAQFDAFVAAAKVNAAATPQDPGAHEANIVVSQKDPHHIVTFESYDDAAALAAHQGTDHYKAYQAATASMISKSAPRQFSSVAIYAKSK